MFLPPRSAGSRPAFAASAAAHASLLAALTGPPLFALPPVPEWEGSVKILSIPRLASDASTRVPVDLPPKGNAGGAPARPQRASSGVPRTRDTVQPREIGGVLPNPTGDAEDPFPFEGSGERREPFSGPGGRDGDGTSVGPGGCAGCDAISASASGVTPPVARETASPVYPELARRAHVEGVVVLEAIIGTDGSVRDARILRSASPLLEAAALEAVRRWRYEPARIGARPVSVYLSVVVTFALRNL